MEKGKTTFKLLSLLFLCSCFDSTIKFEIKSGALTEVANPSFVSFNVDSSLSTYITIEDSPVGDYVVSYQEGTTPPSDCSPAQLSSDGNNRILVPSLTPETTYSFRVCKKSGNRLSSGSTLTLDTSKLSVGASYPVANNWNLWVGKEDTSTLCTGTTTGFESCLHGGESRDVQIPHLDSCDGLSMEDNLDLFDWSCIDEGSSVFFRSSLKEDAAVASLIDPASDAFYENFVRLLQNGEVLYLSDPETWWTNPIVHLNGSSDITLSVDNTLYYLRDSEVFTSNITIDGDNIVLLTLGSGTFEGDGTSTQALTLTSGSSMSWVEGNIIKPSGASGDTISLAGSRHRLRKAVIQGGGDDCIQSGGSARFNSVEDSLLGDCNYGIFLNNSTAFKVSDTDFLNCNVAALELNNSNESIFENIRANGTSTVIRILSGGSHNNKFSNIIGAGIGSGVTISNSTSSYNTFKDLKFNNVQNKAISITSLGGVDNRFIDVIAVGGNNISIEVSGTTGGLKFTNLLTAFSQSTGISITDSSYINFVNAVSLRNSRTITPDSAGFRFSGTDSITCVNCAALNNNNYGFNLAAGTGGEENNIFKGLFISSGNGQANCNVEAQMTTTPGLVDSTCTSSGSYGSSDFVGADSDAKYYDSLDLSQVFNGIVLTEETNADGANRPIQASSITDWLNFDDYFRFWLRDDASMLVDNNNSSCVSTRLCDIWDFSLNTQDPEGNALLSRSFDFESANMQPSSGACPAAVAGEEYADSPIVEDFVSGINAVEITDGTGNDNGVCESGEQCLSRYLKHATELIGDNIGDDDGLCESGEACVYSSNIGVYQGRGDFLANECSFASASLDSEGVRDVTMYYYPLL